VGQHSKGNFVKVPLNDEDAAAVRECARLEAEERKLPANEYGAATLLRELAMPRVLERLAELKQQQRGRREPVGAA
jgi:hypothetical protein